MLYKKASEMKPTPIPHCMGGEGTVMMERLLDAPAEMLGKGRAYVRHTLAPGVNSVFCTKLMLKCTSVCNYMSCCPVNLNT